MRRALLALLLLLIGAARPARPDDPSDGASMKVALDPSGEVDAVALVSAWARRFGAFLVPDPALAGVKVRFVLAPAAELSWGTVKAILELHDVVVVEERTHLGPWLLKAHHRRSVVGGRDSARPGRLVEGDALPATDELVTAVFRIRHGAGPTIFATLRGLLSVRDPNRVGNVLYVQGPELVIVADLAPRVRWAGEIVRALDVAGPRRELATIRLEHAPAAEVAQALTGLLQALQPAGAPQLGPQPQHGPYVHADARANQLVVAADPVDLPLIEQLVRDLDVPVGPPGGRLHVYECKDADATELAATIDKLYGGAQSAAAPGAPAPATVAGTTVGEVRTRVVADEAANRLLVEAEEPRWREIEAVLRRLDTKRLRVHILCEVWEVSTPNDQLAVSVELAGLTNVVPGSTRPLALTSFGASTPSIREQDGRPVSVGRLPNIGPGVTFGVAKDALDRLPIVISALASLSEARLVTRPFATTDDGRPATFTITTSQPVLKTSSTQLALSQQADYVDASTTLGIEPRINSDRSLTLNLTLTIAAFTGSGSPNLPPPRTTRSYAGVVTVPNERWVAFGGLESESETTDEAKVPLLGDVPVLGHLFKSWRRTRARTRVYVFVRPTIFSDPDALTDARAGEALRRKAHALAEREAWLPPVVPEARPAGWDLEDQAFEVFGAGSADPFGRQEPRPRSLRGGAPRRGRP